MDEFIVEFIVKLLDGMKEIGNAFTSDMSIWWLLTPLILFWLLIEVYFGRYKEEKLGWNTALGNALSIFWIIIISVMKIFEVGLENYNTSSLLLLGGICLYALLIIILTFTHKIKPDVNYAMAGPTPIYFFSMFAVLIAHGPLKINGIIMLDILILLILALIVTAILKHFVPASESDLGNISKEDFGSGLTSKLDSGLEKFNDNLKNNFPPKL